MSGQATGWVLRHGPTPDMTDSNGKPYGQRARGLRSVLIAVADAANADGEHAHPGLGNLEAFSLYSRRQVQTTLALLVHDGWLVVTERGGGRGRATEFSLPMMREKVQPVHLSVDQPVSSGDAKGCSPDAERVQSEPETVHSGLHPNVLATQQPTKSSAAAPLTKATDDPVKRAAHALTVRAFEQDPKPVLRENGTGAFPAVMAIFERLLRAGTVVQHLLDAIEGGYITVWTIPGIQTALAHARGRPAGLSPRQRAVVEQAAELGVDPAELEADADAMVEHMFNHGHDGVSGLESGVIDVASRGE